MTSSTSSTEPPKRRRGATLAWWLGTLGVALVVAIVTSAYAGAVTAASVFLGFATLALGWVTRLVVAITLALLREPPAEEVAVATGRRKKELEREKLALLKALKELEFDHEMGKVSDGDFAEISANYRSRAVRVMRQLEIDAAGADYHALVERDLTMRRGGPLPESAAESESEPKPEPEPAASNKTCSCGTLNDTDAEFCKKCGKKLDATEATA